MPPSQTDEQLVSNLAGRRRGPQDEQEPAGDAGWFSFFIVRLPSSGANAPPGQHRHAIAYEEPDEIFGAAITTGLAMTTFSRSVIRSPPQSREDVGEA